MTELEMAVEALKRCVPRGAFERALHQVRQEVPASEQSPPNQQDQMEVIRNLLTEIGMPANIVGYEHTAAALNLLLKDPTLIHQVTKRLYPEAAAVCGSTASRTERGIRHAVETVVERCEWSVLKRYFANSINQNKGKPTNTEFLARMAMEVRKRMGE